MKVLTVTVMFILLVWPLVGQAYVVGDVVDDISFPDLDGGSPALSDYTGKIVVLNFFTTWCVGCNEEAAHLENEIWQAYAGRGVTVVALNIQEQLPLVQGWAAALGITYNIWLMPDWNLIKQFPDSRNIPYNAVLGPDRTLRYASIGFDLNTITGMIDTILSEGQVPTAASSWGSVKALFRSRQ